MATSSSYNYGRNALQIITEALELIQALPAGQTLASEDSDTCLATLNMMIKAWQAEGIGLWKNRDAALILEENEYKYTIGPSGDYATLVSDLAKTEVATAASSGGSTLTVDDDNRAV